MRKVEIDKDNAQEVVKKRSPLLEKEEIARVT